MAVSVRWERTVNLLRREIPSASLRASFCYVRMTDNERPVQRTNEHAHCAALKVLGRSRTSLLGRRPAVNGPAGTGPAATSTKAVRGLRTAAVNGLGPQYEGRARPNDGSRKRPRGHRSRGFQYEGRAR